MVMQKAGGGVRGDKFLTKLITRNLRGKENEISMDLQTGTLAVRFHVAEGGISTVRGFRQVTLCGLQVVYCLFPSGTFVFIGRGVEMAPKRPQIESQHAVYTQCLDTHVPDSNLIFLLHVSTKGRSSSEVQFFLSGFKVSLLYTIRDYSA